MKGPKYKKFNTRAEAETFVSLGQQNGKLEIAQMTPEKRRRTEMIERSAPGLVVGSPYAPKDVNGNVFEPGVGPLPPGAEDNFDPNIKIDVDGRVVNKTEREKLKAKLVPKERESPGMLKIYTDGSSLQNGTAGARSGVGVFFGPQDPKYEQVLPYPSVASSGGTKSSYRWHTSQANTRT